MKNLKSNNYYDNIDRLLCIPNIGPLPISVQGFYSEKCVCKERTTKCHCKEKKSSLTTLTPSMLFQCNSNLGITFTNSSEGIPTSQSIWDSNFVPISSLSNFSINGLNGVKRVILQNNTNLNNIFTTNCTSGPTIQGNPLGKVNNELGLYEYIVCSDTFKFGPIHLGFDNWLQAIPIVSDIKTKCISINYNKSNGSCCDKCIDTHIPCLEEINYEVLTIPLQLRMIFMFSCNKTLVLNMTIFLLACEGPNIKVHENKKCIDIKTCLNTNKNNCNSIDLDIDNI
jgi:hypothetical protein